MKFFGYMLCGLVIFSFVFAPNEDGKYTPSTHARTISKMPTNHKVVALTFDDGPDRRTTPEVLAVLREKKVHATFFVIGENAERYPNLLAEEVRDGHEIGNHSFDHKALPRLSEAMIDQELERTEKAITSIAPKPLLFRPPGGKLDNKVLAAAQNKGYTTVMWSVDPRDWRKPSVEKLVNSILQEVKPGSIILLHDGKYPSPTPQAVAIVIDRLRDAGYELVTVSELLQIYDIGGQ